MLDNTIKIVDIFWDRIYLHIKLEGNDLTEKEFVIATELDKYIYPIQLNEAGNEFIINITNLGNQTMIPNGKWFIKYRDDQTDDTEPWKDVAVSLETCYKLSSLDKVYRYSGNNYAYIFTFAPFNKDGELILKIVDGEVLTSEEEKGTSNENKGEE